MDLNQILLEEIRANRKSIEKIKDDVSDLKSGLNAFKAKAAGIIGLITFIVNAAVTFYKDHK